ncbi:phosphatase PAP2 family protein [Gallaecimonas kandeliae]|uniref:phosphatase PAP2 family protein n=1 Tax=Gallaecimonas kandeliae TaxID=3029055 RepID=UPI002647F917|nr:phosphatase PAP2 family protein [Gallaecimonas kandeliae]WKE65432.1 phosphatase PAP2 family protein [Gallaecimonas kandeliae]
MARYPLALILGWALALLLAAWHGPDFWLAGHFYQWEGNQWALQENWLIKGFIHNQGRHLVALGYVTVLVGMAWNWKKPSGRRWRYLALTVPLILLAVGALKHLTNMDCPWSLAQFGGDRPFIGLFDSRPAGLPHSQCFPAGHASGGYAWLALYFAIPGRRKWALLPGLFLGLSFGIAQQLRGAHFLSHDVWTVMLSLTLSYLMARWLLPTAVPAPAPSAPAETAGESAPRTDAPGS